jgi:hypothetical protein
MTGLFAAKQNQSLKRMMAHMLGAAKFNADTFKQLREDPTTTLQSIILVPITGLCYGIGLGLYGFFIVSFSASETVLVILLSLISAGIIAIIWSLTTFLIVTKLFNRSISYPSLTRPFLFSWSPGLLFVLLSSPNSFVSEGIRILATAWVGVASIFAVRYAGGLTLQQSMITFIMSILILVFTQIALESLLPLFFT